MPTTDEEEAREAPLHNPYDNEAIAHGTQNAEDFANGTDVAKGIRGAEDFANGTAPTALGSKNPLNKEQSSIDKLSPSKETEPTGLYNASAAVGAKNTFAKFKMAIGNNKKGVVAGGGILGTIIVLVIMSIGSFLPFELLHIKEVVAQNLGGVQEQMLDKRRMRIMNKAYFFRGPDSEFAGYKAKGSLFSFVENRKSTKIVTALEEKGFQVNPQLDKNNKFTGRFDSITGPDGAKINNGDSLWQRRSALKTAINQTYPAKSALWRSKQTSKMYKRFGLTRGDWWSDNAATRKLGLAGERLKKKVRNALSKDRTTPGAPDVKPDEQKDPNDPNKLSDQATKSNDTANKVSGAVEEATTEDLDGTSKPLVSGAESLTDGTSKTATKAFGSGVLNVVKITGPADAACQGIGAVNTVVNVSRYQKALAMARYSSLFLSMGDAIKSGKAGKVSASDINDLMSTMKAKDPETGKNFYASAGWQNIANNGKKNKTDAYTTTYNAGGGLTGQIKSSMDTMYALIPGGKAGTKTTCGTINNPLFQIGSAGIGIVAAVFSGGTELIGKAAIQVPIEVAKTLLVGYATQLGVKAATGNIIDGSEKGQRMGAAFSSGAGTMTGMNASARGFKPLTNSQFKAQNKEYLAYKSDEFKNMSVKDKITSPENQNSIAFKSMDGLATIQGKGIVNTLASIPASLLRFGSIGASAATEGTSPCNDEDLVANNIKTDASCNPIMGQTDDELDKIDPIENLKWMVDNNHVDGDGKPISDEYTSYAKMCFNDDGGDAADKVSVLFKTDSAYVSEFTNECFDKGNVTGYVPAPNQNTVASTGFFDKLFLKKAVAAPAPSTVSVGLHERFRAFRLDSGILECTNDFLDQGYCTDIIDGTNCVDTSLSATTDGAPPEDYGKVTVDGKQVNKRTKYMLDGAEKIFGGKLALIQGSYNTGVSASAGTHDGGGAIDVNISGMNQAKIDKAVKALRSVGFAAWYRDEKSFPGNTHIHAIAIGDKEMSSGAKSQVESFWNGKDGLAANGKDNSPLGTTVTPTWAQKGGVALPTSSAAAPAKPGVMYWPLEAGDNSNGSGHDFTAAIGTPVHAMKDGTVVESKDLPCGSGNCVGGYGSYGKMVVIDHGFSKGNIVYAHFSKRMVKKGDKVVAGQVIGLSGETGNTYGPHLHVDFYGATVLNKAIFWLKTQKPEKPPKAGAIASPNTDPTSTCADGSTASGTPGVYKDPLRDVKKKNKERVDPGVDYYLSPGSKVHPLGNATILQADGNTGWPGGGFISYKLEDGPAKGFNVYFAEYCSPNVKKGQKVNSETVLCTMNGSGQVETGWAAQGAGVTNSEASREAGCNQYGYEDPWGTNFNDFLESNKFYAGLHTAPKLNKCKLPAKYPRWK